MKDLLKITLEFEDYRQTLSGEPARKWFSGMASNMSKFPDEVWGANWKHRKKNKAKPKLIPANL